jgi:taurine transport system permease protein
MSFTNSFKKTSVGYLSKLFGRGPVEPGESYGAPGVGNSTTISIATSVILLFSWWFVTNMGWIEPLFLPSPEAVLKKFIDVWNEPGIRRFFPRLPYGYSGRHRHGG